MKVSMPRGCVDAVREQDGILCGFLVHDQSLRSPSAGDWRNHLKTNPLPFSGSKDGINIPLPGRRYIRIKRLIDITVCVMFFGPFLFIAILVLLANTIWSPGPLFFKQTRIGQSGKPFTLIKFRTMAPSLACPDNLLTQEDDDRITKVGKLLRRTRLDEVPQLLNVLRGEMSWIGPRPEAVLLYNSYQKVLPHYQNRHAVLPGVTGLAQVCQGHVISIEDTQGKLNYDLLFIGNISLRLELWIVIRTVQIMISGFGAK